MATATKPITIDHILSLLRQYVAATDAREYSTAQRTLTLLVDAWREFEAGQPKSDAARVMAAMEER